MQWRAFGKGENNCWGKVFWSRGCWEERTPQTLECCETQETSHPEEVSATERGWRSAMCLMFTQHQQGRGANVKVRCCLLRKWSERTANMDICLFWGSKWPFCGRREHNCSFFFSWDNILSSMFRSVRNERMFYDFVVDLFGKGWTQGFSTVQTLLLIALHWAMFFYHM